MRRIPSTPPNVPNGDPAAWRPNPSVTDPSVPESTRRASRFPDTMYRPELASRVVLHPFPFETNGTEVDLTTETPPSERTSCARVGVPVLAGGCWTTMGIG